MYSILQYIKYCILQYIKYSILQHILSIVYYSILSTVYYSIIQYINCVRFQNSFINIITTIEHHQIPQYLQNTKTTYRYSVNLYEKHKYSIFLSTRNKRSYTAQSAMILPHTISSDQEQLQSDPSIHPRAFSCLLIISDDFDV